MKEICILGKLQTKYLAPFDKDIEITEEYLKDVILPINENHNNISSFTEGKGYFLV